MTQRDWHLVDLYTDIASGKSRTKRPQLDAAMDRLRAGDADTLMVAKLDRLSRSVVDFGTLMHEVHSNGWNLVIVDIGVDLSTPVGEVLVGIMAVLAQWERRVISDRTKAALKVVKERGGTLGRPVTTGAEAAALVELMREAGESYHGIAKRLNSEGLPTPQGGVRWYPSTVRAIHQRIIGKAIDTTQ